MKTDANTPLFFEKLQKRENEENTPLDKQAPLYQRGIENYLVIEDFKNFFEKDCSPSQYKFGMLI